MMENLSQLRPTKDRSTLKTLRLRLQLSLRIDLVGLSTTVHTIAAQISSAQNADYTQALKRVTNC